jgi:hypothetical protein
VLVFRFTQLAPHLVLVPLHAVEQPPLSHTFPPAQGRPHVPQLLGSVARSVQAMPASPPQSV